MKIKTNTSRCQLEKVTADNYRRCILAESIIDGTKIVFVNIYAPNDTAQQVVFLSF